MQRRRRLSSRRRQLLPHSRSPRLPLWPGRCSRRCTMHSCLLGHLLPSSLLLRLVRQSRLPARPASCATPACSPSAARLGTGEGGADPAGRLPWMWSPRGPSAQCGAPPAALTTTLRRRSPTRTRWVLAAGGARVAEEQQGPRDQPEATGLLHAAGDLCPLQRRMHCLWPGCAASSVPPPALLHCRTMCPASTTTLPRHSGHQRHTAPAPPPPLRSAPPPRRL